MAECFYLYPPHPIGCFPNQRCQRGWGGGGPGHGAVGVRALPTCGVTAGPVGMSQRSVESGGRFGFCFEACGSDPAPRRCSHPLPRHR